MLDAVTHAVAGAAAALPLGLGWQGAVVGALVGVAPDFALVGRRMAAPPYAYRAAHSGLMLFVVAVLCVQLGNALLFLAWFSHLLLDAPTHGRQWGLRLWWPWNPAIVHFEEWEFFNRAWWAGLAVAIVWVSLCVCLMPVS